jgi:uncharacterized protein with FMN-binding domain
MSRSSLLLVAAALMAFGAAVLTGHPPWGAVAAISIFLIAGAMAAGALAGPSRAGRSSEERPTGQRIPASLVTLSATAILAVYAAGYQRTRDAADHFEAQTARHQTATAPSAGAELPKPVEQASAAAVQTPVAPRQAAAAPVPAPVATPAPPELPAPSETSAAPAPAPPAPAAPAEPAAPVAAKSQSPYPYKDGTFAGWGRCRHGSIQAAVTIANGQIVGTEIAQCLTRYSCSWIENLPGQVVSRQSPNVDYVSGATESTDAFYDAVASALASARE